MTSILLHLLTNEVVVIRLQDIGGDKMALSTVTSEVSCMIQPLSDEDSQAYDGVFGQTFVCYTDGSTSIYPGDTLKDLDGIFYTVKSGGATARQHGSISFVKIIIEKTKP